MSDRANQVDELRAISKCCRISAMMLAFAEEGTKHHKHNIGQASLLQIAADMAEKIADQLHSEGE